MSKSIADFIVRRHLMKVERAILMAILHGNHTGDMTMHDSVMGDGIMVTRIYGKSGALIKEIKTGSAVR